MTSPGQKDTHSAKWERQEELAREPVASNQDGFNKALQVKRWETREEPFAGFNSPPGRF